MIPLEIKEHPDFKAGVELHKQRVPYDSPKLKNSLYHRGYIFEERLSKAGYFYQDWVKNLK